MSFDYKVAFESAKAAFDELAKRRTENNKRLAEINADNVDIDNQMAALKQTMDIFAPFVKAKPIVIPKWPDLGMLAGSAIALSVFTGSKSSFVDFALTPDELGMTQAIKMVFKQAQTEGHLELSPAQVRDRLIAIKFDLSRYDNAMAAIHTTLGRVATEVQTPEGKKYRMPLALRRRRRKQSVVKRIPVAP
jgi:hypothetical protein